jgi:hypothetical protein
MPQSGDLQLSVVALHSCRTATAAEWEWPDWPGMVRDQYRVTLANDNIPASVVIRVHQPAFRRTFRKAEPSYMYPWALRFATILLRDLNTRV